MGAVSVEIGSAPSIARHLAFGIPAGDRERVWLVFAGRAVRLGDAQCMMLDATALSILPIVMAPLLGVAFALLPFQRARGCLEEMIQPRVLRYRRARSGRINRARSWVCVRPASC
jgi:hypothetical protein